MPLALLDGHHCDHHWAHSPSIVTGGMGPSIFMDTLRLGFPRLLVFEYEAVDVAPAPAWLALTN